ncbi:carbonic anhydrase [Streptomyces sp. NPDC015346]|uniref:carbonic anhydrase n=1 Tax=Streptomyces sp. NPDC015346 TaxID=3364954 RepID=UPI0036FA6C21
MTTSPSSAPFPSSSLSRRSAVLALTAAATVAAAVPTARAAGVRTERPSTAARALAELRAGNARFAALRAIHPHEDAARRADVAVSQHPFALVLGCVDSRVPPELVFDQGLGDLLAIRSAGQALDEAVLGSIQFGVEELAVALVVVLGHERCGAATAAVEYVRTGKPVEGHLARVVEEIAPAARATRDLPGDWVENTVRANVARIRRRLAQDEAFDGARIIGARFDLDTGKVAFDPS